MQPQKVGVAGVKPAGSVPLPHQMKHLVKVEDEDDEVEPSEYDANLQTPTLLDLI